MVFDRARRGWMTGLVVLLCVVARGATAQEVPFTGIVTEDNVKARAGAAAAFYAVGDVPRGALVQVVNVISGWSVVQPPTGVTSYISKAYVEARGDGKSGVVTTDEAWVKVAGIDKPAHLSYQTHAYLSKAQTVNILGEEGDFYRITPPENAHVFLPPGAVRRATQAELSMPEAPAPEKPAPTPVVVHPAPTPDPAPKPAAPAEPPATANAPVTSEPEPAPAKVQAPAPTTAPAVVPSPAEVTPPPKTSEAPKPAAPVAAAPAPAPATTPAATSQWPKAISPQLAAAEAKLREAWDLPVEQQPIDALLAAYEPLVRDPNIPLPDRRIAASRVNLLQRNAQIAKTLSGMTSLSNKIEGRGAQSILGEFKPQDAQGYQLPPQYSVVGRLLASSVYDGMSLPRLLRLVDPATGRTVAYVDPKLVEGAAYTLGQVVGIVGEVRFDPTLRLNLIDVQKLDVLEATATSIQPTEMPPGADLTPAPDLDLAPPPPPVEEVVPLPMGTPAPEPAPADEPGK
ncbi:MAG: hypothetical protein IT442_06355 [Phycisphaeraceae bacterium]|nr:hypothetical protein [Phycisphaeraceae bacterium]